MRKLVRRSRAALLSGLAFVVGVNAALFAALERWRPELRDAEFGCKLARLQRQLAHHPGQPLLLALGSSRASYGFRPDALPPLTAADGSTPLAFNLATNGSGPVAEVVYLRRLLARGVRPHWLVVEIMPAFLYNEAIMAEEQRLAPASLSWRDVRAWRSYHTRPPALRTDWLLAQAAPWYANRFALLERGLAALLPYPPRRTVEYGLNVDGWRRWPREEMTAEQSRDTIEVAWLMIGRHLGEYHVSDVSVRAVDDLLALCRKEGIAVAFFLMPESPTFREWYPATAAPEIAAFLNRTRAHGVTVVDARGWYGDDEFGDAHHLLPRAAAAFSERLGRELLAPWVCGQREKRHADAP